MLERTSIALQTAKGNNIENFQEHEVDLAEYQKIQLHRRKFPQAEPRNNPVSLYNCHGLVFASRRAWVQGEDLAQILIDDGYSQVEEGNVLPGDVVIYFDDEGVPHHTGFVVSAKAVAALLAGAGQFTRPSAKAIEVCSKWGHGAEFIHHVAQSPYGANYKFFRI